MCNLHHRRLCGAGEGRGAPVDHARRQAGCGKGLSDLREMIYSRIKRLTDQNKLVSNADDSESNSGSNSGSSGKEGGEGIHGGGGGRGGSSGGNVSSDSDGGEDDRYV